MMLPGFEASISVRHDTHLQQLEEAKVLTNGTEASAYICSRDNARFQIAIARLLGRRTDLALELILDGITLPPERIYRSSMSSSFINSTRAISRRGRVPLVFGKITHAQDSSTSHDVSSQKLGTIVVRIYDIQILGKQQRTWYGESRSLASASDDALKERKRALGVPLSHQIHLGRKRRRGALRDWEYRWERVSPNPIATFRYHYASREVLKACRVLPPCSVTPAAPDMGELTRQLQASNHELKVRLAGLERRIDSLKRERPDESVYIDLTAEDEDEKPGGREGGSRAGSVVSDGPRRSKRIRMMMS